MSTARRRVLALSVALAATIPTVAAATVAPATASPAPSRAASVSGSLDLGRSGLPETRRDTRVAPGVTHTRIVRGRTPAPPPHPGTTPHRPWIVNVATIAPGARGQLRTAIGADIARTEGVSTLGRWSKSHVAVNGSYFHSGRRTAPGDMVGVAVNGGTIISQPQRVAGHVGVIMDSATKALTIGPMTWGATLTSDTGELRPDAVNTPLVNPAGCDTAGAPCTVRGQVVRFTPHYAAATPSGVGAEIVYDRQGCVVRTSRTRGTRLTAAQTSFQATGTLAEELLRVGGQGCPTYREALYGADRQRIPLTRTSFGVTGRYQLVSGGQIVAPAHTSAFFQRHPRTIIGRRADGTVLLVTVDGRSTTSVGVTLTEAARLARSLGLVDAANLDGGGSTAMAVRGRLVNTPPGGERSVADAVVFMP